MKSRTITVFVLMLAVSTLSGHACSAGKRSRTWVDRPWEIRYVLFGEDAQGKRFEIASAREGNAGRETPGKEKVYFHAAALFKPAATFAVPGAEPISVVLLSFDQAGRVISKDSSLRKMKAKRTLLDVLVLIDEELPGERPYEFADWSQGIPGDVSFSPAVCIQPDLYRYADDWADDRYSGNFGCREWTAQLYQRDRPYIDVTTYASHGNFIGEFVGWSRFTDPPKPVIGMHGTTWLCLHDCPAGEKPGVIRDIKAWTARHGYPMPRRPSKQPLYPNADYKDDLSE